MQFRIYRIRIFSAIFSKGSENEEEKNIATI